jgi:N-sulfoglucosamine sulfohydrolase
MHSRAFSLHGLLRTVPLILAAWSGQAEPAPANARPARPNILWIIGEDMGPDLGVYGTPEVRTPHLDALARQGMRFNQCFVTGAVCSPSRSAFNTGMYQTTLGAHHQRSHRPDEPGYQPHPLPAGVRILSDWLRDAGYLTGDIAELPRELGFRGSPHTDWNFTYPGKPFDTDRWSDLRARQPFYAQLNFPEAHRGRHWDEAHTKLKQPADPAKVRLPPYYPDHPVVRQDWAQYLNSIMVLDEKVGAVLQQLERDGLAETTVVIFMSDHGQAMVRGKQWVYDSGLHIPLIIRWPAGFPAPAGYRAGTTSEQLISAIDITATTLAIAGGSKPPKMQGRVFLGPQAEPAREYAFGARDRCDETVDRVRSVRSHRYRYVKNFYPERPFLQTNRYKETNYPTLWVLRKLRAKGKLTPVQAQLMAPTRAPEELYDVIADPDETHNLAASPAHRATLEKMRAALDAWIESTDDQGRFPEDPRVVRFYEEMMMKTYDARIAKLRAEWGLE